MNKGQVYAALSVLLGLAGVFTRTGSALGQTAPAQPPAIASEKATGSLRLDLLTRKRDLGESRDAFGVKSWVEVVPPPPPPPVVIEAPRAPPLPFRYMGRVDDGLGSVTFFLIRGTTTLSVSVGETIDNTYRLESADGGALQLTYLPLKERQSLQIGVGP